MIIPKVSGEWELFYPTKTASTAYANFSVLDWPASPTGYVVPGTSTTTKFAGICQKAITASSSDYAQNTALVGLRPMLAQPRVIATTSGASAASVGLRCDLTDASTVNVGASAVGRFLVTGYHSATEIVGYFLGPSETGAT